MNKKNILLIALGTIILVGLLYWSNTEKPANSPVVFVPPQSPAPAREIPAQVTQNMQQALAEREKKLQALQAANDNKPKSK